MFTLSNSELTVQILDPIENRSLLGSRYCTGGYIWQISDTVTGNLLSGPRYPAEHPPPFDGQGAPEVFVAPLGADDCSPGETVSVIGVGDVLRSCSIVPFHVRDNPTVSRFCTWEPVLRDSAIEMTTLQTNRSSTIRLTRTVSLSERTVTSKTDLTNLSAAPLPIVWFPHPFFPPGDQDQLCRFTFPFDVPENRGYCASADGALFRRPEYEWEKGLFQKLSICAGCELSAEIVHPKCTSVTVAGNYPLASLPVWANVNTFSVEPYLETLIPAGTSRSWRISYRFGR